MPVEFAELSGDSEARMTAALARAWRPDADGVLALLATGAQLPPHAWQRLLAVAVATAANGPVVTPLCAATPGLDPRLDCARGREAALALLDSACFLAGARVLSPVHRISSQLSLWPAQAQDRWAEDSKRWRLSDWLLAHPAVLCDHLLVRGEVDAVGDPGVALAAVATLRVRPALPRRPLWPGLDGRPVVLHVSHSWGGGVARFIRNLALVDVNRTHLVLASSGRSGGPLGASVQLREVLAEEVSPPLREWPLQPAISAVADAHDGYREAFTRVMRDFAVAQVYVSSLLGHALDALRSGVPTVIVNHDYAAWWPELHADFGDSARPFDDAELERLCAEGVALAPLPALGAAAWRAQRAALERTVLETRPTMVCPSAGLRRNLVRMVPALAALEWHEIEHGLEPFPDPAAQTEERALPTGRPRLLIAGRLNDGKGDRLLGQCLEALAAMADVWLLGCGASFDRYLGIGGVHIVFDYRREDLPAWVARIEPQLALLPVSVSESFSYLLGELMALGVPVLATALGALRDRIEDGVDGFLVAPDADAIVLRVGDLLAQPGQLIDVREQLAARPTRTLEDMRADYAPLLPSTAQRGYPLYRHDLRAAVNDTLAARVASVQSSLELATRKLAAASEELERRAHWVARTDALFHARSRELEAACARADEALHDRSVAIDLREQAFAHLEQSQLAVIAREQEGQRLQASLEERDRFVEEMRASRSWRVTRPLRSATMLLRRIRAGLHFRVARSRARLLVLRRSLATRGLAGTLRRIAQRTPSAPLTATRLEVPESVAFEAFALPTSVEPRVSVIVPVFNHFQHTLTCLRALAATADPEWPFEVIVVDDASTDETAERLLAIRGLTVHRQDANAGFIAACNAGLAIASGTFVVLLNNDTAVQPGWMAALCGTFERFPDTGLAGARLVYPDGRLQEAGGIVFRDSSGWNYGRFEDPADPRFNYVREVDYCSGAAIALPRTLANALGGFDPHFSPAYYEDTDLAMRVRAQDLKVRYQPASLVVHFEGVSSGTDTSTGTKRFQPINQIKFAERWHAQLQSHPTAGSAIERAREHRVRGRILIVDACTPMPDHDSGSLRMWNLMRILVEMGWKVSFFSENQAHHGKYTHALQQLGVEALFHPWLSDIPAWLARHGPEFDAVMLSRHTVATPLLPLIREFAPRARLLFDTVDLHFLREERAANLAAGRDPDRVGFGPAPGATTRTRQAEVALVRASDVTLVVSPVEQELLAALVPEARIEILSNVHEIAGRGLPFDQRTGLLFVGGFQHEPNVDAVEWLMAEIWPRLVDALPEVGLHIVGSRMPAALAERCREAGPSVVVHGFVEDLEPLLAGSRLALAPLRYGAGVKGKINQAMAHGLPVIATPLAVEGMHATAGLDAMVAESAEAFAAMTALAYSDEALWQTLAQGGLDNVDLHFSFATASSTLEAILPAR